jgi:hypothetical protein|tara:strand:- start:1024 stop:1242 length:219 start_codon:yes stop_codon:yes gene_type:complete
MKMAMKEVYYDKNQDANELHVSYSQEEGLFLKIIDGGEINLSDIDIKYLSSYLESVIYTEMKNEIISQATKN